MTTPAVSLDGTSEDARPELLVCALCVGEAYRAKVERLFCSLPEWAELLVLSDLAPNGVLKHPRVHWLAVTQPTRHPIHGRFDWMLKAVVLQHGLRAFPGIRRHVYVDGDCFFADPALRPSDFDTPPGYNVMTLESRERLVDDVQFPYSQQMVAHLEAHGTPAQRAALAEARLPLEQLLLVNATQQPDGRFAYEESVLRLPDAWIEIAQLSREAGLFGDPDAVDYGLALVLSGVRHAKLTYDAPIVVGVHFTCRREIERDLNHSPVEESRRYVPRAAPIGVG